MADHCKLVHDAYLGILRAELVPAMGCTEPIAVAYASAMARKVLGARPESAEIRCSANIVKNVKGVVVPNTGGLRGISAAAVTGIVGGDVERRLEVLQAVTDADRAEAKRLIDAGFCKAVLAEGEEGLYVEAIVRAGGESASVVIRDAHTNVVKITKNGAVQFDAAAAGAASAADSKSHNVAGAAGELDYGLLNVRDIIEFADTVDLAEISDLLEEGIRINELISDEGLANDYGASVGKTILSAEGDGVRSRAKARAAAGSDARMGGCALPVMINSGSGNQGLTVSLPVIEYAREWKVSHEKLLRALLVSNLVALEQKRYIGKLSAYCGAVSASVGSGAGIAYLSGGDYAQIAGTITTAIATTSGMVCDGAKSSCAAKIATAVSSAILAYEMSVKERGFVAGEGLVGDDVEATIRNIGQMGSKGMRPTDVEIIKIMLDK
jgi:L-cysteine desulfidase